MGFRAILARRHAHRPCHLRMHRGVHRRICHAGRAGLAALFCALCPGPAGQAAGGAHCQIRARIPRSTSRRCGAPPVPHRGSAAALRGRYRDADFDLHHARLGLECGRRARWPARSRLRRLLRGRRLQLRADLNTNGLVLLGLPAACRLLRSTLGHDAWFPCPAPSRRLFGHRDARLWRDHPHRPHQLAKLDRRPERHQPHPAPHLFWPALRAHGQSELP